MRKTLLVLTLLGMLPAAVSAEVTKNDLKTLIAAGISEPVIVAFVGSHGPLAKLSPEDLIDLKKSGATDGLLAAVLSARPPAAAPSDVAPPLAPAAPVAGSFYATYPADYSSADYGYTSYYDYPSYYYGSPGYCYGYGYPWYSCPGFGFGVGFGVNRFGRFNHFGHPGFSHFSGGHVIVGHSGTVGGFHGGFGGAHGGFGGGHGGHR